MSIVYLFVSILLLYQSVIKIDVPNKWASACVQPAITKVHRGKVHKRSSNLQSKNIHKIKKKLKKNLAAEKSGDTGDRLITDQRYNGARCTEA